MRSRLIYYFLFCSVICFSQSGSKIIDSLEKRISNLKDTHEILKEKATLLLKYYTVGQPKKSLILYKEAQQEALKLNSESGLAALMHARGTLFYYESVFDSALIYYERALTIRTRIKDNVGILKSTVNIGSIYFMLGDHKKALTYYEVVQRKEAELHYEEGEYLSINNLGTIYNSLKIHNEALNYFRKAEKIYSAKKNNGQLIYTYEGLANVYKDLKKPDTALLYAYKAKHLCELLGESRSLGYSLLNIALFNKDLKNYQIAKSYLDSALYFADMLKDKRLELASLGNKAAIDLILNQPDSAYRYMSKIMVFENENEFKNHRFELAEIIARYYYDKADFKKAFAYIDLHQKYKDSLYNSEVTSQINEMKAKYETEKKDKENQLLQAENKTQKTTRNYLIIILTVAIITIVGAIFANTKIRSVNTMLEVQKKEIKHQKEIVENKQKEMLDSINYARRIQFALLASDSLLKINLPEHFVLFKPKDIVSGDFYWATKKNNFFYLAVCDSTGHGVPGAFMSLLNINFLNEAINEKEITAPHEILNHVRNRLIENMDGGRDGMDAILVKIPVKEQNNFTIEYAAANNVPVLIRNKQALSLLKDKMPVGRGENINSFNTHTMEIQKGDTLYLYTDGFADQFGGPKGKKFMYKQLDTILLQNSSSPLAEQKNNLITHFENWKGSLEQVDDVCVVGMQF